MAVMNSGCNTEQTAPLFGAASPRQSTTRIRHYKLQRKGRLGKLFPVHSTFRVVILHDIAQFGGNSIKWPRPFFKIGDVAPFEVQSLLWSMKILMVLLYLQAFKSLCARF